MQRQTTLRAYLGLPVAILLLGTARAEPPGAQPLTFLDAYRDGYARLEAKEPVLAEAAFRQAATLADSNQFRGAAWVRVGEALEAQQKWDEAVTAYSQAADLPWANRSIDNINAHPTIADALKRLEWIYQRQLKDPARLRQVYERCLAFSPDNPGWQCDRLSKIAETWFREGNVEQGSATFERAAEVPGIDDNRCSQVLHSYGDQLNRAARYDDALAVYRRNIALPGAHPHRRADSLNRVADILRNHKKDLAGTRQACEAILAVDGARPDQRANALVKIGDTWTGEKHYDEAQAAYTRALEAPDVPPNEASLAHERIGDCLARSGKPVEARRAYETAADIPNLHPNARSDRMWKLALTCRDQGDKAAAIAVLGRVLKLDKLHPNHRKRAEQELQRLQAAP